MVRRAAFLARQAAGRRPGAWRALAALALGAGLWLAGPAAPAQADPDHRALVRTAVDAVVIPAYARFDEATATLEAVTAEGCGDLAALRAGYHAAMDAWQGVQHIRFGPIEAENRHYRVQFWPDNRNMTRRHLAGLIRAQDGAALAPERFAEGSVAVQGLPALERLLFEDADALSAGDAEARFRCALVEAIGANLARIGAAVRDAWRGPYRETMLTPGPDNPAYRAPAEATRALHGALAAGLQAVIDLKLAPVLHEGRDTARPRRAESHRADRALVNLRANLAALRALYRGGRGAETGYGFDDALIARGGAAVDTQIDYALRQARDWLAELGPAMKPALESAAGYDALVRVHSQLALARPALEKDLAGALGLTMGFNALDGD